MLARINKKARPGLVLALNAALVVAIIVLFLLYMRAYNQKLYDQNLSDIGNINQATAQIASEVSASQERKLNNIRQYLARHEVTVSELMTLVDDFNADDSVCFHLIGEDYVARVLRKGDDGTYPTASYQNKDYQKIQRIVDASSNQTDAVPFTAEFTNPDTGLRSFGRYIYVMARDGEVVKPYTLLAVFTSSDFIGHISRDGGFAKMSTVLINEDGSYALSNSDFKSDNLFQYLYAYNDLSLDELNEIRKWVFSDDGGNFRYLNSEGAECVFVYSGVPGTQWYCVSCVPIANFHNSDPDFSFTGILVALLALMMAIDMIYLSRISRRFRQSALEANAANEAKTDFLSRMSHDIRTPINVISGMTELALLESNSQRTEEYLKNIQASGKFLLGLVNDILDMNKVESGNMELHPRPYSHEEFKTYINAVVRPLCDEKHLAFSIEGNMDGLVLMVDSLRFNQIFFNLLSNAVKFTPPDGHIALCGNVEHLGDGTVELDISIADDGEGMSEAFQETMFAPFSQEERTLNLNSMGTGLGLAIVKRLVELMGGTIRVESAVGEGTTFRLHFVMEVATEPSALSAPENANGSLAGKRILLCEDHPLNAKIIDRMLALKCIIVDSVENGKLGVEKFSLSRERYYDAILMDIRMPVMNGLEAARAIRALERSDAKTVPIIALTANAYDSDVENCHRAGMNCHLAKPVDTGLLYETLLHYISEAGENE